MIKPAGRGLAAFAAACVVSLQGALGSDVPQPLSGQQLRSVLLGNTVIGSDDTLSMYYPTPDIVWGIDGSGDVDVGRWWVENDSYCRVWRRWYDSEIRCWQLALGGNESVLWYSLDGKLADRSWVQPGNVISQVKGDRTPGQPAQSKSNATPTPEGGAFNAGSVARGEFEPGGKERSARANKKPPETPPQQEDQASAQPEPKAAPQRAKASGVLDPQVEPAPAAAPRSAALAPAPSPAPDLEDVVSGRERFNNESDVEIGRERGTSAGDSDREQGR